MISFVSKLFSGLFVISLEIRLHKKTDSSWTNESPLSDTVAKYILLFAFFIFFVRQKCSVCDEQVDNHRKLLQTFRYGICQFANVPVCLSAHQTGSYGVTNPDSLLCHRSPRLQCCADKLQNHPCLSCHCCKISFSANTPQSWKYNSYFRIVICKVMLNSCRVCRKAKNRGG